jgi:hypothetical protein
MIGEQAVTNPIVRHGPADAGRRPGRDILGVDTIAVVTDRG